MRIVDDIAVGGDSRPNPVDTRANRLRHAMKLRGVQTNELDRKADIGSGWASKFLNGQKPHPGAETVAKVCRALRIRSAWLLEGEGPMESTDADETYAEEATSAARIMAPVAAVRFHPDVEATVRLYRNKKRWSAAALAVADEVAKARHVEPDALVQVLDSVEAELDRIRERFRRL